MMTCPMRTRATVPRGFPKAPRIPVWSLHRNTVSEHLEQHLDSQLGLLWKTCTLFNPGRDIIGSNNLTELTRCLALLASPCLSVLGHLSISNLRTHLSAPAQDNILLMRMTWKGWSRTRMWNPSLPQVFTMYLLAQIRAASRAAHREGHFSHMLIDRYPACVLCIQAHL